MKVLQFLKKKDNLPLLFILLIAFLLRFYKLGFESFWLDELHTMNEADPAQSFSKLFDALRCCDQHPPLFFFCERFIFSVFGRTEITGRFFPALSGVASVWAMYLLGKEVLNKNLGLMAAAFTCVNYFNLYYSREARGYILAFFLAALSFVFLIRLIKSLRTKDMWWYSLFALLTMYTHYFGIFLVGSQFLVALILLFSEENKKVYLKRFALSGVIIAVGYLPWVPFVLKMSEIKTFWIGEVSQDFVFSFANAYFGNSDLLKPVVVLLLLFYVFKVFGQRELKLSDGKKDPLTLSFVVFSVSIVGTFTLPYIRSVLTVPMMIDRYTIVVVPAFLAAAAYGVELIADKLVKTLVFTTFILWSLTSFLLKDKPYTVVHKTQFREMTAYMAANPSEREYPIVNDRIFWQEGYYITKFNYAGPILSGLPAAMIDSIIQGTSTGYRRGGFWLMNAHGAGEPAAFLDATTQRKVDSFFVLEKEMRWHDAWAQLYISKSQDRTELTYKDFPPGTVFDAGKKLTAIWAGAVISNPILLKQGNYTMRIVAQGTPALDTFPHLIVSVNDKILGDYYPTRDFQDKEFTFREDRESDSVRVKIELTNDCNDPKTKEDRNAFLSKIVFVKQ